MSSDVCQDPGFQEVLLHLLRHVPGEQLATLVNVFEDDEGFEPDGPVFQLLQEASRDYKLLQENLGLDGIG